jgi:predicted phage terminase large subunit-like protein
LIFKSEDEQNRYLLYYYLNKAFIDSGLTEDEAEDKTKQMVLNNSNNLFGFHGLAWQLGKISMEFFCLYFLQDTFLPKETNVAAPIADVHRKLWSDIENSIVGNGANQIGRIEPRGTGKSAFGTFATSVWAHCYELKKYTLICSDIGTTAQKFIKDIKNTFLENEYIKKAFGVLLDDKDKRYICNSNQLELTNKTFIEAISSESPMRGRKYDNCRPDLIVLDDYQSEDDVRTEDAREKKWKRFSDDVKYAVQKAVVREGKLIKQGTVLIALGTLQHKDCFYSRLMRQPTWKFKSDKGVLIDDFINEDGEKVNGLDNYFNTGLWLEFKSILFDFKNENHLEDAKEFYWQHEKEMQYPLLWQEFWDCLDMALSYYENPSSFKQEVQSDVNSIGEKWFKTVATERRCEIEKHKFIKTMLLVDPASTAKKKSDYSAYLVGSLGANNLKYCRKAELAKINARTDFDKYIDHMIDLLKEYREIKHIYIEKNTFNGADANQLENKIKTIPALRSRNITIINESQRKNKDDKISTIIPYMNKGQIIFAEEDEDFIEQILDFRGQMFSIHDDAPDITSEFVNRIDNIKSNSSSGPITVKGL